MAQFKPISASFRVASRSVPEKTYPVTLYADGQDWCECGRQKFNPHLRPCHHIQAARKGADATLALVAEAIEARRLVGHIVAVPKPRDKAPQKNIPLLTGDAALFADLGLQPVIATLDRPQKLGDDVAFFMTLIEADPSTLGARP